MTLRHLQFLRELAELDHRMGDLERHIQPGTFDRELSRALDVLQFEAESIVYLLLAGEMAAAA